MNLDEIQEKWQEEPDEYLLKAVEKDINEYPVEVQGIIMAEANRRKFHVHSVREELRTRPARRRKHNLKAAGVVFLGIFLYILVRMILFEFVPLRSHTKNLITFLLVWVFCRAIWPLKEKIQSEDEL